MTVEKKKAIEVKALAFDDIFVHHQDYMNLIGAKDGILKIGFDTDQTVKQLIDALALK
jgi:hypothetical protein